MLIISYIFANKKFLWRINSFAFTNINLADKSDTLLSNDVMIRIVRTYRVSSKMGISVVGSFRRANNFIMLKFFSIKDHLTISPEDSPPFY